MNYKSERGIRKWEEMWFKARACLYRFLKCLSWV